MLSSVMTPAVVAAMILMGIEAAIGQPVTRPSFDCGHSPSGLAEAICRDPATWEADWSLTASYWASYFSVDGADRTKLRDDHVEWIKSVARECGADTHDGMSETRRVGTCVARKYRVRIAAYRNLLSGEPLAEASLRPEVLVAIQSRLIELGFMAGQADGVFGAGTRQAIRLYRQSLRHSPGDFLDEQERIALLPTYPVRAPRPAKRLRGSSYGLAPSAADPQVAVSGTITGLSNGTPSEPALLVPPPLNRQAAASVPSSEQSHFSGRSHINSKPALPVPGSEFSDAESVVVASPLSEGKPPAEAGVRIIEVKGVGESADAARKDAARLAIQQVVGVFIDNRRRIELNVSDTKVSEVINEKIISYTNAYVTKMDIVQTEQKGGAFEVTAKIGVSVAPLLKVLQDNAVPTAAFDTASAASTVETLSQEKTGAIELYADLVRKADTLIKVGVGKPQVDPSLPSSPDEAWLKIPLTFALNDDAAQEWRKKFDLFAQQRADVDIKIRQLRFVRGCDVFIPRLEMDRYNQETAGFIAQRPPSQQQGVAACFPRYETERGLIAECLGRAFVTDRRNDRCVSDKPCLNLDKRAEHIRLVVELLDGDKNVIYVTRTPFRNYPAMHGGNGYRGAEISLEMSRREPLQADEKFFNYCVETQAPLFWAGSVPFGTALVFPPKGSKMHGYLNLRLSNSLISRVGSVSVRIDTDETKQESD